MEERITLGWCKVRKGRRGGKMRNQDHSWSFGFSNCVMVVPF
jgi:hypothetical protein